jgi:Zn-dependent protease
MFSKDELRDIVISVLVIAIIFSYPNFSQLPLFLLIVVIAFVFHELAHRTVARRFGCVAIYKIWVEGLILGLVLMFMKPYGFIPFVAPGAVVIYPFKFGRWGYRKVNLTQIEMGLISISGISVNLIFALVFKLIPGDIFNLIGFVNAWLALFNLLPIPPLDGSKVMRWKASLWLVMFIVSVLLVLSYLGII